MPSWKEDAGYLLFDTKSVVDPRLVAKIQYPEEDMAPEEALERYRNELLEKRGTDFIPYTYQVPVSLAVAKVRGDFSIADINILKYETDGPRGITRGFWEGWAFYNRPTFVTFNGRTFDLPLMELAAYRYGISIPQWLFFGGKSFEQPRNRYNLESHIDLADFLTNFGATHFSGGLSLAANIIAKPGKITRGNDMVNDLFREGRLDAIHDISICDLLDTYFVFLRTMVIWGKITVKDEHTLCQRTLTWIHERISQTPVFRTYLKRWEAEDKGERLEDYFKRIIPNSEEDKEAKA